MSFLQNQQLIMDRICRVCLQYKTDLFFIFDEQFSVDAVKMPQLLTQCTRHNVDLYDRFPHNICGNCVDKALFVFRFQQQAEKSHRTLTNMFASVGVNPCKKSQTTMEMSTQTDNVSLYPCEMCGQKFFDSLDLIEHHLLQHPCKKDECNVCDAKFKRLCQLRNDRLQVQRQECARHLYQTANFHSFSYESSTVSLPDSDTDENGDKIIKDSIATIQTDFEEYETKVDKNDMFQYDPISIDDSYDYEVVNNISTSESMGVTKANECNSGPDTERSPPIFNEVLRGTIQIPGCSYPRDTTLTIKNQSLLPSEISRSTNKCFKEKTETAMQHSMGLQQKHYSCHLCRRNFFTMEFLNKHLIEIHNQDLECSNEVTVVRKNDEITESKDFQEEVEQVEIKPVISDITKKMTSGITKDKHKNVERLNEEPPDNSLLTVHHNFKPSDAATENSSKMIRPKKEKFDKIVPNHCHKCNRTFSRKLNLWQHLAAKKCVKSESTFRCETCDRVFARNVNLVQHLSVKKCQQPNTQETFCCKNCGRVFSRKVNLLQHLSSKICKKLNKSEVFRCNHCNRIFSRRVNLSQHIASKICKTANNVEKTRCRNCGGVFSRELNLRQHLASKVCEKLSCACPTCGKVLSSKQHLKRHMKIHAREKLSKCQFCDQRFTNELELKMHIRHHSKLKKIICKICGKHCQPKYLKIHMRTHTGDRPFKCQKCSKTYTSINNLSRHEQEAHGECYKCDKCSAVYLRIQRLREHIAAKH